MTVAKVTGLQATVDNTDVSFTWTAVSGATGYELVQYNETTKEYNKVSRTTEAKATLKGMEEGKTYRFAVRAYMKDADGKEVYGDYSDPKSVKIEEGKSLDDIKLTKVTGVSAVKTDAVVTLSWTAVTDATGYEVATFNGAAYTKVTEATGTSVQLKTLERHKELRLVVRAFAKSGTKAVYGDYSDPVSVIVYNADYYGAIFHSGTFRFSMAEDLDGTGKQFVNFAVKNGNVNFSGTFKMDSLTMPMEIRYVKKTGKIYMKSGSGLWGDVTEVMKDEELGMGDFMDYFNDTSGMFSDVYFGNGSDVVMSTETKEGKTYDVETVTKGTQTVKLYTENNDLRYLWIKDSRGVQESEFKNVSGDVSDDLFAVPSGALTITDTFGLLLIL